VLFYNQHIMHKELAMNTKLVVKLNEGKEGALSGVFLFDGQHIEHETAQTLVINLGDKADLTAMQEQGLNTNPAISSYDIAVVSEDGKFECPFCGESYFNQKAHFGEFQDNSCDGEDGCGKDFKTYYLED